MESNNLQQHYPGFQHVEIEVLVVSDRQQGMAHPMSHSNTGNLSGEFVIGQVCAHYCHPVLDKVGTFYHS